MNLRVIHQRFSPELLGPSLCKRYLTACKETQEQAEEFEAFTASLNAETRTAWQKMVTDWERDFSKPDPYLKPHDGMYLVASLHIVY